MGDNNFTLQSWVNHYEKNEKKQAAIMEIKDKGIHQSEWDWIGSDFNYTIENEGSLEDLGNQIDGLLQFIKK